ncbi:hypothetical protein E4634_13155 [Mangrovimicrobium sediminis]|uniref:Glycosyltransferase RgtA/B/C/D-like domain-containing protein n=1 Tax=Mangrovimicrobium sediminis TaxID=2562682 RepID=A0A4Z0LZ67_9GAMM|nr:hypothetical protein [Haliea sp. SAOS-164]TGD72476.1 hypothetical protein E4634_13155 [Haliea sp. SAOS-164]
MSALLGALLAIALPWLVGGVWVYWLLGRYARYNTFVVLGHGYLLGVFLATAALRAWGLTGLALNFWGPASALALLGFAGAALAWRRPVLQPPAPARAALPGWQLGLAALLLLLLAWRYLTIGEELLLRPLYPWDAWMNWSPKAIVWFHYREFTPFVSPNDWLLLPPEDRAYTLGAFNAWKYPVGVPLLELWGMLAVGSSDSSLVFLPWVAVALALAAILYGHLRLAGAALPLAVLGVYLLFSQPFVNVHSALAGYADLWVAATFAAAVFALTEWEERRSLVYAGLALAYAAFCAQLKIPGIILAGMIIALLVAIRLDWRRLLLLALPALALLVVVLTWGIHLQIPGLGPLTLSAQQVTIPAVGDFRIEFHPVQDALLRANFLMINWHLLWYVTAAALVLSLLRPRLLRATLGSWLALVLCVAFLLFVYFFTGRYRFALDYSQVNRAFLYAAPLAVFFVCRLLGRLENTPAKPADRAG